MCIQSVLVHGNETWAMNVDDLQRLERSERMMVRWMCGGENERQEIK